MRAPPVPVEDDRALGRGTYSFIAPKRKTILIVDDDDDFLEPVAAVLRQRGHRVFVAQRGSDAAAAAERRKPDVIVIDGLLPDIDGISWIASLRRTDPHTALVFVSAFAGFIESIRRMELELDISLVVPKPIDVRSFCEKIERCGEGRSEPPPATKPEPYAEVRSLAALRADYARALPDKLEGLSAALRLARSRPEDRSLVAEARSRAHKLSGSAGAYGFPEVGEAAAAMDQALGRVLDGEGGPAAEQFGVAERALADAVAAASRGPRDAAPRRGMPIGVGGARILAVALEAAALRCLEEVGQTQLFEVVRAGSPAAALDAVRVRSFDAALVGLAPDEAAAFVPALRDVAGCAELPVAFARLDASIDERVAAARIGGSLFLETPMRADAAGLAVRQLLAIPGAERPRVVVAVADETFSVNVAAALERAGLGANELADTRQILDALERVRPSVLVLDPATSGVGGIEICRMLRSDPRWQDLPIIVVTAQTGLEARLEALRAGADDVLADPLAEEELVERARALARRMRLLRERFDRDLLTGLPLRRPFLDLLGRSMAECRRHGRPLAVALLDLDFFKGINDRCGHGAGDRALAATGQLLAARFRTEDLRGRWGGEEFALAFPGETGAAIQPALVQVLSELASIPFGGAGWDESSFRLTFSAGLASHPADGASVEALLDVADRRLYEAKRMGRARVVSVG